MPNYVGYTPEPWQLDVHKAIAEHPTGTTFVCLSPRQVGKTTMIINELLRASINNRWAVSLCISVTLDGSRKIYREITQAIEGSGCVKKKNDSLLTLEFVNGSIIYFRSGEQGDSLRGMTIKNGGLLCIDEAAYQPNELYYSVLLPMTNVYRADILLTSTPRFRSGFFFELYEQGLSREGKVLSFNFTDYDLSKFLPGELLEQYAKVMPKNQFASEYLGEWVDGQGMVFEGFRELTGTPGETKEVFVGIDWGSGKGEDYTALAIFNQNLEMVELEYFNNLPSFAQVEKIIGILKRWNVKLIESEDNSIGTPMNELLRKTLNDKGEKKLANALTTFTTTNKSKIDLVAHLQVRLERKDIKLLNDNMLMEQLGAYEAAYSFKTGQVSYAGAAGTHDDVVMCTLLALDAYNNSSRRGSYLFR